MQFFKKESTLKKVAFNGCSEEKSRYGTHAPCTVTIKYNF